MFICREDHDRIEGRKRKERKPRSKAHSFDSHLLMSGDVVLAGLSHGPCEVCGRVADCVDCHK